MTYPHGGGEAVYRDNEVPGQTSSPTHNPEKAHIRDLLRQYQTELGALLGGPVFGTLFETTATGITGTSYGDLFVVVDSTDNETAFAVYTNNAGVADLVKSYPTPERIETAVAASEAARDASGDARDLAGGHAVNAGVQALAAEAAKDQAVAAAEASGDVAFYDTRADADTALPGLADGVIVEVMRDETRGGRRVRYCVESSALVFKIYPVEHPPSGVSRLAKMNRKVASAVNAKPIDHIDGVLYGTFGIDDLYRSLDDGATWGLVDSIGPGAGNIRRLIPCADGEVLMLREYSVLKSVGWPAPTSWTEKVSLTTSGAQFIEWSLDGDGTKFIAAEYGLPRTASQAVHASLDGGDTWSVMVDKATTFPLDSPGTHFHGVAYDPWVDRFWLCMGDVTYKGVWFSDDDGTSWTECPIDPAINGECQATSISATPHGMVLGSDSGANNGVYRILRTPNPADMVLELIWRWPHRNMSIRGFCFRNSYDPVTGLTFMSWRTDRDYAAPIITWSDGVAAGLFYEFEGSWAANDGIRNVVALPNGKLRAWISLTAVDDEILGVDAIPRGAENQQAMADMGMMFGGQVTGGNSGVAVGPDAVAAQFSVAIGAQADANTTGGMAIGWQAVGGVNSTAIGMTAQTGNESVAVGREATTANNGVAVGRSSNAAGNAIAIGTGADAAGSSSVVVGDASGASAAQVVAVGAAISSTATAGVLMGYGTGVTGNDAVAVGFSASVAGLGGVAIGRDANVGNQKSIAIGKNANANAQSSIVIGDAAATSDDANILIGGGTTAVGGSSVVIGGGADALGQWCVAIGRFAEANGNSIAIGVNADALQTESVAIGTGSVAGFGNSATFGARDVDIQGDGSKGLVLRSPDGTRWRVTVDNSGNLQTFSF